jgi:phage gpG-like protein
MDLERKQLIDRMNSVYSSVQEQYSDLTPLLDTIAEIIEQAIDQNFSNYGRWNGNSSSVDLFSGGNSRWKPLATSTIKVYKRRGINPLKRTLDRTANMRDSINVTPHGNSQISIRMASPYGAAHNFGFKGKVSVVQHLRKNKSGKEYEVKAHTREMNVPASPFLTLTDDDIIEIIEFIESQLF